MGMTTVLLGAVRSFSSTVLYLFSFVFLLRHGCNTRTNNNHGDSDSDSDEETNTTNIHTMKKPPVVVDLTANIIDLTTCDDAEQHEGIKPLPLETCSICLCRIRSPFNAYTCTECHGQHHAECQMQWFKYTKHGVTCPLCRSKTVDEALLKRLVMASKEQKEYKKHIEQRRNMIL